MHTHAHTRAHAHMHTHTHTHMQTHIHTHTRPCAHAHMHTFMHTFMCCAASAAVSCQSIQTWLPPNAPALPNRSTLRLLCHLRMGHLPCTLCCALHWSMGHALGHPHLRCRVASHPSHAHAHAHAWHPHGHAGTHPHRHGLCAKAVAGEGQLRRKASSDRKGSPFTASQGTSAASRPPGRGPWGQSKGGTYIFRPFGNLQLQYLFSKWV